MARRGRSKRFPKKGPNSVKGRIKRPGALTALVGGKPSENMGAVQAAAKSGTPLQKKQANYFLNVLKGGRK